MAGVKRPLTRWTADTEVAFLLALRLTGSVAAACAAIGRSTNGADERRKRLPDFADRWQAVLDEKHWEALAAEKAHRLRTGEVAPDGAGAEMPNRARYDGFTPLRQRAYLRALTETGRYEEAARAVGISTVAVRVMRNKYPSFAAACERALARSAGTLEQVAFERATQGWDEPIVHAGKVVGQRRRYSDALLRMLVQQEARRDAAKAEAGRIEAARAEAAKSEAAKAEADRVEADRAEAENVEVPGAYPPKRRMTTEEVNDLLMRKLDKLAEQNRREARARQLAWADEMVRRGLAP